MDLLIAIIIQKIKGGGIKMRLKIGRNFYQVKHVDECRNLPAKILVVLGRYPNSIIMIYWENARIAVFLEVVQQKQRFNIKWTR